MLTYVIYLLAALGFLLQAKGLPAQIRANVKGMQDLMAEYEIKCRLEVLRAGRKRLIQSNRAYSTMFTPEWEQVQLINAKIQEECDAWSMIKYGQVFGLRAQENVG